MARLEELKLPVHRCVADRSERLMSSNDGDVFAGQDGQPCRLRGVSIYSNSLRLAEMAARIGFDTIWIEMEHGPATFDQVEALCMAAQAGGAVATVRVPDGQRHHVLRALEAGARIVVVPMINTAAQARELVQFGKFPPLGLRGFNLRSRGVEYGIGDQKDIFRAANARTHLFAQIETMEAVENVEAICRVEGLAGILIGPGDLSVSAGCAGDMNGGRMIDIVTGCVRRARSLGCHAGILVPPGPLLDAALDAGCDLFFCGGDVTELALAWPQLLAAVTAAAVTTTNGSRVDAVVRGGIAVREIGPSQ